MIYELKTRLTHVGFIHLTYPDWFKKRLFDALFLVLK
jgi:hypothetical protein